MTKVLVVCTGNTCRSPLLAALVRRELAVMGRTDVTVDSAGTGAAEGDSASVGTRRALQRRSLSADTHRSQNVGRLNLGSYTWIWCMSSRHAAAIRAAGVPAQQIAVVNAEGGGIPDPFGGDDAEYEACAVALETATPDLLALLPPPT